MSGSYLNPRELDFLLYEWMGTENLLTRPRYSAQTRKRFDSAIAAGLTYHAIKRRRSSRTGPLPAAVNAAIAAQGVSVRLKVKNDLLGKSPRSGPRNQAQLKNQARIQQGLAPATIAYCSFQHALEYARQRPIKYSAETSNPTPQRLVEQADVRCLLLKQKAYSEGALALCFLASSLLEDTDTGETEGERQRASALLDALSPVVASWPLMYGARSNHLAIQVLSAAGNQCDSLSPHPLEQLHQDQCPDLDAMGDADILASDLLGSGIAMTDRFGYDIFKQTLRITLQCCRLYESIKTWEAPLEEALGLLDKVIHQIARNPERGASHASLYLEFFGSVVIAWVWLVQGHAVARKLEESPGNEIETNYYFGKLQAARYFMEIELPQAIAQAQTLLDNLLVCNEMREEWF